MSPPAQLLPSEKHERDESSLHEEGEYGLYGERRPEDIPHEPAVIGPVGSELKFEHEARGNGVKSKAQDVFIKMIDSNDKDAFTSKSISAKVKALGGENSVAGKEFRGIIRNVDEMSKSLTRRFTTAYHVMLKIKRPAVPFLVAGAGVGFLTGFAHNVMKTDFDA